MNTLNEQRAAEVADQLSAFKPEDATPMTDFTIDPLYSLIAHLPEHINDAIHTVAIELGSRFPEHYYYLPEQYHLTIVPIPYTLELDQIIERITPILEGWRLPIEVRGLCLNRFQASAVLYPKDESLLSRRSKLRAALDMPEQAFTLHRPIWEELLLTNILRFKTQPTQELIDFVRDHAQMAFGSFVLDHYELYDLSTKTLDPSSSRLLHTLKA